MGAVAAARHPHRCGKHFLSSHSRKCARAMAQTATITTHDETARGELEEQRRRHILAGLKPTDIIEHDMKEIHDDDGKVIGFKTCEVDPVFGTKG
jgi:hypothetical protein